MQLAETFEPELQAAEFILPTKYTLNGVQPFLEDLSVEEWLAAAVCGSPRSGLGLMFGTISRLKIAFRLRRQS